MGNERVRPKVTLDNAAHARESGLRIQASVVGASWSAQPLALAKFELSRSGKEAARVLSPKLSESLVVAEAHLLICHCADARRRHVPLDFLRVVAVVRIQLSHARTQT